MVRAISIIRTKYPSISIFFLFYKLKCIFSKLINLTHHIFLFVSLSNWTICLLYSNCSTLCFSTIFDSEKKKPFFFFFSFVFRLFYFFRRSLFLFWIFIRFRTTRKKKCYSMRRRQRVFSIFIFTETKNLVLATK